jgi:hypothetical protein
MRVLCCSCINSALGHCALLCIVGAFGWVILHVHLLLRLSIHMGCVLVPDGSIQHPGGINLEGKD